jgi:pantoate--beta-alanine ligase
MKVVSTDKEIRNYLRNINLSPVGLVPTMGALHEGHMSLVSNAKTECPVIVISIYVNPTQFNDKEDLKKYPRTLEADLALLKSVLRAHDIVFTPSDEEIYPEEDKRVFHFGNLDNVMEALHRPGHFNGIAQVISKLFDIVRPDNAYFGLKDFQQVAVVKELVRQNGYKVKIKRNPIIREPDGLAMSSRNRLLEPDIRRKAPIIFRTISEAAGMIYNHDIPEIKRFVKKTIEKDRSFRVEYFEIADDRNLITVHAKSEMKSNAHYFGCIAVRAGKIRLIDNIEIPLR